MLTLIGVVLWLAPHALGAAGVVVLASPVVSEDCEADCARATLDRRSHCEAQFPEPGQRGDYDSCLTTAEEIAQGCKRSCAELPSRQSCSNTCLAKAISCVDSCPCGEDGPCYALCKPSWAKCNEYCGVAVEPSSMYISPKACPPPPPPSEPDPEPSDED